jgi:hypothetical protein
MKRFSAVLLFVLFAQGAWATEVDISWSTLRCLYKPDSKPVFMDSGDPQILGLDNSATDTPSLWPLGTESLLPGDGGPRSALPSNWSCLKYCHNAPDSAACFKRCNKDEG